MDLHTQDSAWQDHPVFSFISAANLPLAMFMEKKNYNNMMTIEENEKCVFLKLFILLFSGISGLEKSLKNKAYFFGWLSSGTGNI